MSRLVPTRCAALLLAAGCSASLPSRPGPTINRSIPGHTIIINAGGYRDAGVEVPEGFQLSIQAENDGSGARPIRDRVKLRTLWNEAAARKCAPAPVELLREPDFLALHPQFCKPFPGEVDCAQVIVGDFVCR